MGHIRHPIRQLADNRIPVGEFDWSQRVVVLDSPGRRKDMILTFTVTVMGHIRHSIRKLAKCPT